MKTLVRKTHENVYGIFFLHTSFKLEAIQMSNNRIMDKQIVLYLYNRIVPSIKENEILIHAIT